MAAKLPFFKFDTSEWLVGDISSLSLECQGGFIALCAIYWHYNCEMPIKKAKLKLGEMVFNQLLDAEIIKTDSENVIISFLDEQLEVIQETKQKNSEAGKNSAEKRKKLKALVEQPLNEHSTTVEQPLNEQPTDKIREDKKEDKIRLDKNNTNGAVKNFKKFTKEQFANDIKECHDKLDRKLTTDRLRDFYLYWTEPNQKGIMRFQLQQTWETGRRLATWRDRDKTSNQVTNTREKMN